MDILSKEVGEFSSQQRILIALKEARAKLDAVERDKTEPIAIVGMGCRFPGNSDTPEAFWRLMRDGVDAMVEVPSDRWDIDEYYDPNTDSPGKMYTRESAFVQGIDQFDPDFFRISPREAISMDPQQRLLLEVVWEALENAGQSKDLLRGSLTGLFMGMSWHDYERNVYGLDPCRLDAYAGLGNCQSIAIGRLAFFLGVHGPVTQLDTACSASLVSVHMACQSLRSQECDMALAGGVNLIISPLSTIFCCKIKALSPAGRCKTFDASADGYARGEGCGVIVLKRLRDALANGDNIQALIRSTAINHDGPSSGLTVPSRRAQQRLIEQALAKVNLDPLDVKYIEAHGTGTSLGDPIEIGALGDALGKGRSQDQPLIVGSVKTNVGHLEAAAGIAGLMKVVLALQHGEIPPHLHFKDPNPHIDWDSFPITIPTEATPWPEGRRLAGVSSFGFSGTNSHVVLEEAPKPEPSILETDRPVHILTLSAKAEKALTELAERYDNHFADNPSAILGDTCFTANAGRSHFDHRLAIVADSVSEFRKYLSAVAFQEEIVGLVRGELESSKSPKIAFLFTGQGAQFVGMGRELYETQPVFRAALERCDTILRQYLEKPLIQVLYPESEEESPLNETAYTQPALFAIEYALAQLWQSWGIIPSVVMGHSVGEYVAACIAGVFSLEDGLKMIAARGRLMQALPQNGDMVAVMADEARVISALESYSGDVAIAALNGPKSMVISGKRESVQAVIHTLEADGIKAKKLTVSHAFHSPLMDPMLEAFENVAREVNYSSPKISFISNVDGDLASKDVQTPEYWRRHVRQPVRFAAGMNTLHKQGYALFLEIGPQPILLGMGRQCLPEGEGVWLPSLRLRQSDWHQMLHTLGELYIHGAVVDWAEFDGDYRRRRVVLPTYPFQRQRYWIKMASSPVSSNLDHPLLGRRVHSAALKNDDIQFEAQISLDSQAFLNDHCIYKTVIMPGTAYLEMALAAGASVFKSDNLIVEDAVNWHPLIIPENEAKTVQLLLTTEDTLVYNYEIFSLAGNKNSDPSWIRHASGKVLLGDKGSEVTQTDLASLQSECDQEVCVESHYQSFRDRGMEYGSSFRGIEKLRIHHDQALGQIRLAEDLISELKEYKFHPALLDVCFHVVEAAIHTDSEEDVYIPMKLDRLQIYRQPEPLLWSWAKLRPVEDSKENTITADLQLFNDNGDLVAGIAGLSLSKTRRDILMRGLQKELDDLLYQMSWLPKPCEGNSMPAGKPGSWLIFADQGGIGQRLAALLQEKGERTVIISAGQDYNLEQPNHYHINPAEQKDFQRLLQELTANNQLPDRGVLHLWSLSEGSGREITLDSLQDAQVRCCRSVLSLLQLLSQIKGCEIPRLWLVTRGVQQIGSSPDQVSFAQTPLWGLGRVLALENPEFRSVCLDLDPSPEVGEIQSLFQELSSSDKEDQIAYRHGIRHVARLVKHIPQDKTFGDDPKKPCQLMITTDGILDNIRLVPMTRREPTAGEVEIQVCATGLNFRDVLTALGMLKDVQTTAEPVFGFECAGKIVAIGENVEGYQVGDEVMAKINTGGFSNFITVNSDYVAQKPKQLSFSEAATIPLAFLTAYYGLHTNAQIKSGDRVLIHAAAGGVGQAAIQLAQQVGAEVFATASPAKWDFLKSMGVEKIMNSRTLDFAEEVMRLTDGEGVDIVLNSLNGEFISKSFEVLGKQGRFIEIGKLGIWDEEQVSHLRPDVSYFPFDLGDVIKEKPDLIPQLFNELVHEFQQGHLKPLPLKVFPIENAIDAFRYMAQAKHVGKVVISQPDRALGHGSPHGELVKHDGSYLVTGGLGGLGLKVAEWLVEKGARHIVLTGRRGATSAAQDSIKKLEETGAKVTVLTADVSIPEDVSNLFKNVSSSMPSLRGIIHAAGVLDDGVLMQQDWDRFSRVMAPKVAGTWNLHWLSKEMALDFFVCFSSAASMLGSPGQGNYAAANAFMDGLVHFRRAQGLPGLSINWGPWAEVGMAAELSSQNLRRTIDLGWRPMPPEKGLLAMTKSMEENLSQVGVLPINLPRFIQQFSAGTVRPFFLELASELTPETPGKQQQPASQEGLLNKIKETSGTERKELLIGYLQDRIMKVIGLASSNRPKPHQSLSELGFDSLLNMELRNWMKTDLKIDVPLEKLMTESTIEKLGEVLFEQLTLASVILSEHPSDNNVSSEEVEELTL